MKSTTKSFGVLLTAAVLSTTVLKADDKPATPNAAPAPSTAAGKTSGDLFDPVIAKGKGVEIKRSQLDDAISGIRSAAAVRGQQISASDMAVVEKSTFDHLLQVQLLNNNASDADKTTGKTEGDKRMEIIRQRAPSEEALTRQLKGLNLTVDVLHKRLIEEATAEAVLRDNIKKVSDADVKKFYDDNPSKFEEPEQVRASHILISTGDPRSPKPMSDEEKAAKHKIAEDLLKRAKAGEDFAKLAKEYSDDPGSKDKGGEYTFARGQMIKEFEAAAFSLQTNQISDIVTTVYGYHIIKLSEKIPAQKVEFAKVSPEIKNYLERAEMEKMLPDYYKKLKKDANVEILDDELKKLEDTPMEFQGSAATLAAPAKPATPTK